MAAETGATPGALRLERLWSRGRELLGVRYAILGGAMSWLSDRHLVAAISNAGGFGVIACGAMTPDLLEAEIEATNQRTEQPFGVNLITMHPQIEDLMAVCARQKVGHVVLAGGLPRTADIERLKEAGIRVLGFAPALAVARRLVRAGIDGIIVEGAEAGGHIGPVATSVLCQEILPEIDAVPVFVAGGIGRGEAMALYLEMGAAGVQLGTRFVCAEECIAHADFKRAFIRANARDAVPTVQVDPEFPVIPVRALVNRGSQRFIAFQHEVIARYRGGELEQKAAQLEIEHFWAGALKRAAIDGDVEEGSLMAGQSVGLVKSEQPTADIMAELVEQATAALERQPG
ncbi:MAG TPA: nitronate monooxygenase family protein [Alphaproteobacteria bacterium]|nr:nitronate monooxygenase family protein [Alphaproteobacteria bacterium]MDP6271818.1 nitronate monooxygenase family protein [Alphaproteobacteria bacterium]MDP7428321.1 nitronate monooxygenase family protein [Alphaproteobacteria bacterium]HJM50309.1 nitronate monooxygenase family protein [Alphaproteobacteria bacterium]